MFSHFLVTVVVVLYALRTCAGETCQNNPCKNGGTCTEDASGGYKCTCPSEFSGRQCESDSECECDPRGKCDPNSSNGWAMCECHHGYHGDKCLVPLDFFCVCNSSTDSVLRLYNVTKVVNEVKTAPAKLDYATKQEKIDYCNNKFQNYETFAKMELSTSDTKTMKVLKEKCSATFDNCSISHEISIPFCPVSTTTIPSRGAFTTAAASINCCINWSIMLLLLLAVSPATFTAVLLFSPSPLLLVHMSRDDDTSSSWHDEA